MAKKDLLIDRFEDNYEAFKHSLRSLSRTQLFEKAARIAAVTETHEMLTLYYEWEDEDEIDFLLLFRDPLTIVADLWFDTREETSSDVGALVWNACNNDDQRILVEYPRAKDYDALYDERI
jgi:hypothetical protein